MYSFPSFEPVCCSMSSSNYCFLIYIQVSQETGKVVCYAHFFKNCPQFVVTHTVKGFNVVNEAEIDVFQEFPCFLQDPGSVGNLISDSSASLTPNLYIRNFLIHLLLKPSLKGFEHNFASMWNEHNCTVILTFFDTALLWDWNENWPFPVLWPICWYIECSTLIASSFRIWNSSTGIPSPPLVLFVVMLPKAQLTSHSRICHSSWVTTHCGYSGH